jgi:hypothetical protein
MTGGSLIAAQDCKSVRAHASLFYQIQLRTPLAVLVSHVPASFYFIAAGSAYMMAVFVVAKIYMAGEAGEHF